MHALVMIDEPRPGDYVYGYVVGTRRTLIL